MRLRKRCGAAGGAIRGWGEHGSGSRSAAGPELTGNVSDMALQGKDGAPGPPVRAAPMAQRKGSPRGAFAGPVPGQPRLRRAGPRSVTASIQPAGLAALQTRSRSMCRRLVSRWRRRSGDHGRGRRRAPPPSLSVLGISPVPSSGAREAARPRLSRPRRRNLVVTRGHPVAGEGLPVSEPGPMTHPSGDSARWALTIVTVPDSVVALREGVNPCPSGQRGPRARWIPAHRLAGYLLTGSVDAGSEARWTPAQRNGRRAPPMARSTRTMAASSASRPSACRTRAWRSRSRYSPGVAPSSVSMVRCSGKNSL